MQTKDRAALTTQSPISFSDLLLGLKGMQGQPETPLLLTLEQLTTGYAHGSPTIGCFCLRISAVQMIQFHTSHMHANPITGNSKKCSTVINCGSTPCYIPTQ